MMMMPREGEVLTSGGSGMKLEIGDLDFMTDAGRVGGLVRNCLCEKELRLSLKIAEEGLTPSMGLYLSSLEAS